MMYYCYWISGLARCILGLEKAHCRRRLFDSPESGVADLVLVLVLVLLIAIKRFLAK